MIFFLKGADIKPNTDVMQQKKQDASDIKTPSSTGGTGKDRLHTVQDDEPAEQSGGWDEEGWGDIEVRRWMKR